MMITDIPQVLGTITRHLDTEQNLKTGQVHAGHETPAAQGSEGETPVDGMDPHAAAGAVKGPDLSFAEALEMAKALVGNREAETLQNLTQPGVDATRVLARARSILEKTSTSYSLACRDLARGKTRTLPPSGTPKGELYRAAAQATYLKAVEHVEAGGTGWPEVTLLLEKLPQLLEPDTVHPALVDAAVVRGRYIGSDPEEAATVTELLRLRWVGEAAVHARAGGNPPREPRFQAALNSAALISLERPHYSSLPGDSALALCSQGIPAAHWDTAMKRGVRSWLRQIEGGLPREALDWATQRVRDGLRADPPTASEFELDRALATGFAACLGRNELGAANEHVARMSDSRPHRQIMEAASRTRVLGQLKEFSGGAGRLPSTYWDDHLSAGTVTRDEFEAALLEHHAFHASHPNGEKDYAAYLSRQYKDVLGRSSAAVG